MLDVNGELFDMWEFRSIQKGEVYNEVRGEMDYQILINKNAAGTNYNDLILTFETIEEREEVMTEIRMKFDNSDSVVIL
jgi:hypothetical protein